MTKSEILDAIERECNVWCRGLVGTSDVHIMFSMQKALNNAFPGLLIDVTEYDESMGDVWFHISPRHFSQPSVCLTFVVSNRKYDHSALPVVDEDHLTETLLSVIEAAFVLWPHAREDVAKGKTTRTVWGGICQPMEQDGVPQVESIGEENDRLRKRISVLEDILWEFISASVEHYKDAPDSANTWPVQIERDLVNMAVKALENESEVNL